VVWDEDAKKILLVDHKKAQLWLPAGGRASPSDSFTRMSGRAGH
jgi:hypothetical protein